MVKKRADALSRRTLIGAASAAPVLPMGLVPIAQPDPLVTSCAEWLTIDFECDRLSLCWAALERRLVDECRWFTLSTVEQDRLPQAAEMFDIEERLDRLSDEREVRLEALAKLGAQDLHGVGSKLAVAARLLLHEGGPIHQFVADAVRVLAAHNCPNCGAPYVTGAALAGLPSSAPSRAMLPTRVDRSSGRERPLDPPSASPACGVLRRIGLERVDPRNTPSNDLRSCP